MKQFIKQIIRKTNLYYPLYNWIAKRRQAKELVEWERKGKPVPPPHIIKQKVLREYSKKYGLRTMVETGTYIGDMIEAMKKDFDQIYSIELSKNLHEECVRRFKKINNIKLIHGDSGSELGKLMNKITQPTLFWLDGHYSDGVTARGDKDTPIYEELNHILVAKNFGHVIIIDDARCFGRDPGYPSVEELGESIKSKRNNLKIIVQDDIIRITPKH